jgi:hypothetical protein
VEGALLVTLGVDDVDRVDGVDGPCAFFCAQTIDPDLAGQGEFE